MPRTNRHGIPVYPLTAAPPPLTTGAAAAKEAARQARHCCWPGCSVSIRPTDRFFPMCVGHAYTMYEMGKEMEHASESHWTLAWKTVGNERFLEMERLKAQRKADAAVRGDQPGYIYFTLIDGQIKIGYARDVKQRMRSYPPTAELLAVHPGTLELERKLHQQFRAHLMRGREWFSDCDEIRAYCTETVATFGDPGRYAYHFREARPVAVLRPKGGVRHFAG